MGQASLASLNFLSGLSILDPSKSPWFPRGLTPPPPPTLPPPPFTQVLSVGIGEELGFMQALHAFLSLNLILMTK